MKEIMIIEDEADMRETLADVLKNKYDVTAIETCEKGLLQIKERKPDLILLDIMTPGMHGATFLQRLRSLPDGFNDSKVIVLTNLDNDITRDKVAKYDIVSFHVKANTPLDEIVRIIDDCLEQ